MLVKETKTKSSQRRELLFRGLFTDLKDALLPFVTSQRD